MIKGTQYQCAIPDLMIDSSLKHKNEENRKPGSDVWVKSIFSQSHAYLGCFLNFYNLKQVFGSNLCAKVLSCEYFPNLTLTLQVEKVKFLKKKVL